MSKENQGFFKYTDTHNNTYAGGQTIKHIQRIHLANQILRVTTPLTLFSDLVFYLNLSVGLVK